jgi:hypothetical protein
MNVLVRLRLLQLQLVRLWFFFGRRLGTRGFGAAFRDRGRPASCMVVFGAVTLSLVGFFLDGDSCTTAKIPGARWGIRIFTVHAEPFFYCERNILVDRTGVRLLFLDAKLRQQLQYSVGFDFQFASQLIDSDFQLHR